MLRLEKLQQTIGQFWPSNNTKKQNNVWSVGLPELTRIAIQNPSPLGVMEHLGHTALTKGVDAIQIGKLWLVLKPQFIHHMMKHQHDLFPKGTAFDPVRSLYGETLSTSNGESWEQRNRIFSPGFKRGFRDRDDLLRSNSRIADIAEKEILEYKRDMETSSDPYSNIQPCLTRITLKVAVDYLFDYPLSNEEVESVTKSIKQQVPLLTLALGSSFLPGEVVRNRILQSIRPIVCAPLHRLAERIVAYRLAQGPKESHDLLAHLLRAYDVDVNTTRDIRDIPRQAMEQLKSDFSLLLIAGYDTTSSMLCWTLDLLAEKEYQSHLHKIEDELESFFHGEPLDAKMLREWDYLGLVGQEILRLRTPVIAVPRMAAKTITHDNLTIPSQSLVIAAIRYAHMIEWQQPLDFDPTRHQRMSTDDQDNDNLPAQLLFRPFWGKQHRCLGQNLAMREFRIVIALLLKHFSRWEKDPNRPTKPNQWGLLYSPRKGPWLQWTPRQ